MTTRRPALAAIVAAALLGAGCGPALAQAWPTRSIRLVSGFPPGGTTDINARILAQKVAETLGQPVVVDSRPGAGGNIAAGEVARAAADGYTLLYNTSSLVIAPALYSKLPFDPQKSFAPVVLTATVPMVLVAAAGTPYGSLKEMIAFAQAHPDEVRYASSGVGTPPHLAAAMLAAATGTRLRHIPYKGAAPALQDVVGGQLDTMVEVINTVQPYVAQGRIKVLATASARRLPSMPAVPTFDEAIGGTGLDMDVWQGVVAPAGTPAAVVARLNAAFNQALADPEVKERLARQGATTLGGSAADYAAHLQRERVRMAAVVKSSGATLD